MHSDGHPHPTKPAGPRRSLPRDSANTPRPATDLGFATFIGPCWLRHPRYRVFAQPPRETKSRGHDGEFLGGKARKRNHRVRMLGQDPSVDSEAHAAGGAGGSHWRTVSQGVSWRACVAAARTTAVTMQGLLQGVARKQASGRPANPATSVGAGWLEMPCAAMTRIFARCSPLHHAYGMVLYYCVFWAGLPLTAGRGVVMQCGGPRLRRRVISWKRVQMNGMPEFGCRGQRSAVQPRWARTAGSGHTSINFGCHAFQGCTEKYLGLSVSIVPLNKRIPIWWTAQYHLVYR